MGVIVTTPEAVLSYPNLFTPRAMVNDDGTQGKPKFSCTLLFEEGQDLTKLVEAAVQVAQEKWGADADKLIQRGQVHMPFRNDLDAKPGYAERAGPNGVFFNTRSEKKPGIVYPWPDPQTGKAKAVTDPDAVYPGLYVRARLSCYAYDRKVRKGVTFGLEGLQIIRPGERLDGRISAEDAFDVDPEATPADFSALPGAVDDDTSVVQAEAEQEVPTPAPKATKENKATGKDLLGSLLPPKA